MRRIVPLTLLAALAGVAPSLFAQDHRAEIQKRITTAFAKTRFTADHSDIVTAGSVLILHKDGLQMCSIEAKASPTNTYKNGTISMGVGAKMAWGMAIGSANQQVANIPQRRFVADEKFLGHRLSPER